MTSSAKHCVYLSQQVRPFSPNNPYALLNWDWKIWQRRVSFILIEQVLCLCFSSCVLSSDSHPEVAIVGELIYKKDTVLSCTKEEKGLAPAWEVIMCPRRCAATNFSSSSTLPLPTIEQIISIIYHNLSSTSTLSKVYFQQGGHFMSVSKLFHYKNSRLPLQVQKALYSPHTLSGMPVSNTFNLPL